MNPSMHSVYKSYTIDNFFCQWNVLWSSYLSYQTGEDKDTDKEVQHLKRNLIRVGRLFQTSNVNQTPHGKIVTSQVSEEKYSTKQLFVEEMYWKNLFI